MKGRILLNGQKSLVVLKLLLVEMNQCEPVIFESKRDFILFRIIGSI